MAILIGKILYHILIHMSLIMSIIATSKHKDSHNREVISLSLLLLTIIVVSVFSNFNNQNELLVLASDPPIDGIQCGAMEQLGYHIHAHLDIFVDSNTLNVPPLVGITDSYFYWLHTHDQSGIIHIESPIKRDFTIGQFLDIWNKKYGVKQIFNKPITDNKNLSVYVNGNLVENGTNFNGIVFHPHDEIVVAYGKSPSNIPVKYNFAEGL